MKITVDNFDIDVDFNSTAKYRDMYNNQCTCANCLNYYRAFENNYPELAKFLSTFGIDIHFPLDVMDFFFNEEKQKRQYCAYYSVKGTLPVERIEIIRDNADIVFRNWNIANEKYYNTGMEIPYFIIEISNIFLPWSLDEPMND